MPSSPVPLNVHFLPQFVAQHELADGVAVVIDLLRASTTICHALAAGATEIIPFVEIADTWNAAHQYDRAETLLGGERGGRAIEAFDLGNSPAEYRPEVVFGKRILFTTTNGTRALEHARLAERVLVGAIANLSAVVDSLCQAAPRRVDVVCAGTAGHVTREDILAAGALVGALRAAQPDAWQVDESAERAAGEWEELATAAAASGRTLSTQLAIELRNTPGGRNLISIDHADDLVECAEIDRLDIVPELDVANWRIYVP